MVKEKTKVPVYSTKVMMELVRKGFDVVGVADNDKNPRFKVFFFENTPEILEELHLDNR